MPQGIKGKFPLLSRLVCEVRYYQGYTYLDRCGRTINTIREYHPQWIVAGGQVTPQSGSLINVETGAKFSFSSLKLDMGIDRPVREGEIDEEKIKRFALDMEEISSIVIDQLGLAEFSRIGCRVWYMFPAESEDEAWEFINSLDFHSVSPTIASAFGGNQQESSLSVTITTVDRDFKIGLGTVERSFEVDSGEAVINVPIHSLPSKKGVGGEKSSREMALIERLQLTSSKQKQPPFASVIDIDAFRKNPAMVKPGEFVLSTVDLALQGIRKAADSA